MLSYLPKPYPDELFYSIIARYFAHIGGARGAGVEELFGRRGSRAQVDLPSSLGYFAENAAALWGLTAEEIAERYTLFPYYTYFANETVKTRALEALVSDSGMGLHSRLGINRSRVRIPQFLRYCPECVSQDFELWSETYWRRTHQLPGVLVCIDHKRMLANSAVPYRPIGLWDFIDATEATHNPDGSRLELSNGFLINAWKIARRCEDFLLRKENRWSCDDRKSQYREAAMNVGFRGERFHAYCKILNQGKLEQSFVDFFGREFLNAIECDVYLGVDTNWLRETFRTRTRNHHPVQHALLQVFFEETPANGKLSHPFGHAPWKCPNPYCDQDTEKSIRSIWVRPDCDGRPVASACCPCGFRFSFRTINGESPVIDKMVLYGPTWAKKAKDLIESGLSKRAASQALGVSQGTIDNFLEGRTKRGRNDVDQEIILGWRKEWHALLEQVPGRSRDKARTLNSKLYDRLRRHDSEWLFSESRRFVRATCNRSRIDWEARDRSLVESLRSAAKELRESVPLKRASREGIIKHAKLSRLTWKKKEWLPMCAAALRELEESVEDFRARRLRRAAVIAPERGLPLKSWALLKLTGLREKNLTPPLAKLVEELVS